MSSVMFRFVILLLASLLVACGGGSGPDVEYSDTNLIVDGTTYGRRALTDYAPSGIYEHGVVYVVETPEERVALELRLDQLGLIDRFRSGGIHRVQVPNGWEDQWARALRTQSPVQFALVNVAILSCCDDVGALE